MKGTKHTGKYCNICGHELTSWDLRCSKAYFSSSQLNILLTMLRIYAKMG